MSETHSVRISNLHGSIVRLSCAALFHRSPYNVHFAQAYNTTVLVGNVPLVSQIYIIYMFPGDMKVYVIDIRDCNVDST